MVNVSRSTTMVARVVDWSSLAITSFVLAPLVVVALLTGDARWWRAMIVALSVLIASERARLAPVGTLVHGLVITVLAFGLGVTFGSATLFVIATAALAGGCVLLTGLGAKLRAVSNWTFIPVLYLACEMAEGGSGESTLHRNLAFMPFCLVALMPPLVWAIINHGRRRNFGEAWSKHFRRIMRDVDLGRREPTLQALLATVFGVMTAAALVKWQHLDHGQWTIWSAASIVMGEAAQARRKITDRTMGALVGVLIGIAAGLVLPHTSTMEWTIGVGTLLTVVAFRVYLVAFTTRCACAALALSLASQSSLIASERAINVLLGGFVGIAALAIVRFVAARWPARRPFPAYQE